jgi:Zn-finger nucleic acid-binding protein
MICPVDGTSVLVMTERQGIEIDYCPTCRGVWLDRGELDKILDRVATAPAAASAAPPTSSSYDDRPRYEERPRQDDREWRGSEKDYKKRKRKSFLDDLFDFG